MGHPGVVRHSGHGWRTLGGNSVRDTLGWYGTLGMAGGPWVGTQYGTPWGSTALWGIAGGPWVGTQ